MNVFFALKGSKLFIIITKEGKLTMKNRMFWLNAINVYALTRENVFIKLMFYTVFDLLCLEKPYYHILTTVKINSLYRFYHAVKPKWGLSGSELDEFVSMTSNH